MIRDMWRSGAQLVCVAFLAQTGSACSDAPDPTTPPDVPIFEGSIDLEIGEIDGDDPYLFTYIGSIVEDDRGRVIVADTRTSEIRVFDPDGRFAFRFGGPGEGPGELTEPCCLEFDPDGELWVRESTRYSAFRLDSASAEYERGLRSPNPAVVAMGPFTFGPDGQLVDIGPLMGGEDGSVEARFHIRADGVVDTVILAEPERQHVSQATVPRMFGNFQGTVYLHQPFGPRWVHAHAPGGAWAEAVTSVYSINYHHPRRDRFPVGRSCVPGAGAQPGRTDRCSDSDRPRTPASRYHGPSVWDSRPQASAGRDVLRPGWPAVDREIDCGRR